MVVEAPEPREAVIEARRAVEALRSGVPNRAAVRVLGSGQPHIEERFHRMLDHARSETPGDTGLLVAGDFGAGKSHLLEALQHLALDQGFVASKVVISKETPLHDLTRLYRAALQVAVAPGKRGTALVEIAAGLDFASPAYADFYRWVHQPEAGLNSRFPATVFLYERSKDAAIQDRILALWSGDPLNVSEMRSWLRSYGEAATYRLEKVAARALAAQRFRFATQLMRAAGYAGWVLLVDEVELMGRYSFMQRARSYAALAHWMGHLDDVAALGPAAVLAITTDFASAVLEERGDLEHVPARLRSTGADTEQLLAGQAEAGMRVIRREAVPVRAPDAAAIERAREAVRSIYRRAYQWQPPMNGRDEPALRMRQYVRRWINEWDLVRADPGYKGITVMDEVASDYSFDPNLDVPPEDNEQSSERLER